MNSRENISKSLIRFYRFYFEGISKRIPRIVVIVILIQLLSNELKNSIKGDLFSNPNTVLILIGIGFTLYTYFFNYLESEKSVETNPENLRAELNELKLIIRNTNKNSNSDREIIEEIRSLKNNILNNQTKGLDLNESDKIRLFELFETKLEKNLSQEFLETIQQKFGSDIIASEMYSDLLNDLIEFKDRMRSEIKRLSLRANTNLAIGSVATVVALIVLYMIVETNHMIFTDSISLTSYYIPRISFVVFIEVFGFFFLKLYKSNLDNVRYYHNEMTNIETKIISLKSAIINADKITINAVINELSKTERNFVIKKGETTIELERLRTDRIENKSLIDFARSIINKQTEK
jgi:hypothetical protein